MRIQVAAAGLLAVWCGLALWAAWEDGPVNDEMYELQSGERLWRTGRRDLTETPLRLGVLWHTLPWRLMALRVPAFPPDPPPSVAPAWRLHHVYVDRYRHAQDMFYRAGNSSRRLLSASRIMGVAAMAACGMLVFHWAGFAYGAPAALLALGVFVGQPLLLAFGHLARDDGVAAVTVALATWAFLRWLAKGGSWRACLAGVALGAALAVKQSSILLLPVFGAALLWTARTRSVSRHGLLLFIAAAWLLVAVLYGFQGPLLNRTVPPELVTHGVPPPWVISLYRWAPVPEGYARGFLLVMSRAVAGDFPIPYAGEIFAGARWWMAPWAFLCKMPVGGLLILALLAVTLVRKPPDVDEGVLLGTCGLFVLAISASGLFHGSRYLTPVLPLLAVLAGRIWTVWPARRGLLVLGALAGIAEVWLRAPEFIPFANLLVRGPASAVFWTAAEDVDIGQDLPRLSGLMRQIGPDALILSYSGNAPPDAYGLTFQDAGTLQMAQWHAPPWVGPDDPRLELFAISATHLVERRRMAGWAWLDARRPVARAGSIWIYDITAWREAHQALATFYRDRGWREGEMREHRRLRRLETKVDPSRAA